MSNIRFSQKEDNYHAWLQGDLNISNINEIRDVLNELLGNAPKTLAVNFRGVEYIDSSVIAVLVSLLKTSISKNSELIFYDLKPEIQNIFEVAALDKFFNIISKDKFEKDYEAKVL